MAPGVVDGSLLSQAHPVLDFGERLFDRIEVGGVWRQVPEPSTSVADHLTDGDRLVGAEIIHHDDVAGFEHRYELLLDIGAKALTVDRSIEDTGCGEPIAAQRAEESQGAPMSVRGEAAQAFALRPPPSKRRHVGLDPGFIDEDQPSWIEASLPGSPALSPSRDVSARLLKGEQCFF